MGALRRVGSGHDSSNAALCGQCGKDKTLPDKDQKIYAPCWNCVERDSSGKIMAWTSPIGCLTCSLGVRRRDQTCNNCGVYVSRWGLLYNGERLPQGAFDRYPAAWRIGYWAAHGAPERALLPYIKEHLSDLANLHFVNIVRRDLGLDPYPEFADARAEFMERHQYQSPTWVRAGGVAKLIDDAGKLLKGFDKPHIETIGRQVEG